MNKCPEAWIVRRCRLASETCREGVRKTKGDLCLCEDDHWLEPKRNFPFQNNFQENRLNLLTIGISKTILQCTSV